MTGFGVMIFMTFLSIWMFIERKKMEDEYEKEHKKVQDFIDAYYKKDQISIKKLVTRYKNER